MFIVEPQWNPSVENQAIARALRLGQKQAVLVTRYVVDTSVEQVSEHFLLDSTLCSDYLRICENYKMQNLKCRTWSTRAESLEISIGHKPLLKRQSDVS